VLSYEQNKTNKPPSPTFEPEQFFGFCDLVLVTIPAKKASVLTLFFYLA
jgi:hypothetical protein